VNLHFLELFLIVEVIFYLRESASHCAIRWIVYVFLIVIQTHFRRGMCAYAFAFYIQMDFDCNQRRVRWI